MIEDLHQFVADFGVDCTFTRASTTVATAKAIFDAPPIESAVYDRSFYDEKFYAATVLGQNRMLYAVLADVAAVRSNDSIILDAVTYYVSHVEPDGTGMMFIHLSLNTV